MLRMKYLVTLTLVALLMASGAAFAGPWIALEYVPPVTPTSVPVANDDTVAAFGDVATDFWAWAQIEECAVTATAASDFIVQGYGTGDYQPSWQVTRAQMAVFIARAAGYTDDVTEVSFGDVADDYWAYTEIEQCVSNGVVQGYADYFGTDLDAYLPTAVVDRAQMAVYIGRAVEGATTAAYVDAFDDVEVGFWAADWIQTCVDANIVQGYDDGTYKPDVAVTRAQMAVFVWRGLVGDVVLGSGGTSDAALDTGGGNTAALFLPDVVTATGAADVALAEGVTAYVVLDAHKVTAGTITFEVVDSLDAVVGTDNVAVTADYDDEIDTAGGVAYLVAAYEIDTGLPADDYTVTVELPNGAVLTLGTFTVAAP